jgi:imidazolonepropionase-like amidohydrolase
MLTGAPDSSRRDRFHSAPLRPRLRRFPHPAVSPRHPRLLLVGLAAAASSVLAPASLAAQDPGYERTYVIQAEAAWLSPTERISPAFVLVEKGRIQWVAKTNRSEQGGGGLLKSKPPPVIQVEGTLAPGIVDAWCAIGPGDLRRERREQPLRRVTECLPIQRADEDVELIAQILAARESGIVAAYLSSGTGALRSGVGSAVSFSGFDLPVAKGLQALDCAVGTAVSATSTYAATELLEAFDEAGDWRESLDEHREKLEQYDKDLAEYRKKFDEFVKKKDEAEAKAKADKEAGKEPEKPAGKEEKPPEPPKRPTRPKEPRPSAARDLLLEAVDGKLAVRVEADDAEDVRQLLRLRTEHGVDLVILGGWWADLVAKELADAEVPVVLAALPDHHAERFPDRSLVARWRTLRAAGVTVALASGGGEGAQSLLLARAGELVAAGEDPAEVWAALTTVPAALLGLEEEFGRLGNDFSASMLLFGGSSPFDASAPFKAHKPR